MKLPLFLWICKFAYKKVGKKSEKIGEKDGRSYFCSPQKYECHSHIAPDFGGGAQERCLKECRSLTHCWKNRNPDCLLVGIQSNYCQMLIVAFVIPGFNFSYLESKKINHFKFPNTIWYELAIVDCLTCLSWAHLS